MNEGLGFVDRMDDILKRKNLKRLSISDELEIPLQTISNWKTRGNCPPADTALKIADFLGVSVEWLITGETKSGELSPEESQLVDNYATLDPSDRRVVDNLIESLLLRYTRGGQMDESEKRLG